MSELTERVEAIARIIEPCAWENYDRSLAPYKENRGAYASKGEAFWYQLTWRIGCRTPEDVHQFWIDQPIAHPPHDMEEWTKSKIKARAIIFLFPTTPIEFPYHETFNAIVDAVKWREHKTIGISVEAFQESFNRLMAVRDEAKSGD